MCENKLEKKNTYNDSGIKVVYILILIDIFLFIVGGNVLSVSFFNVRFRISELFSIFLGIVLIRNFFTERIEKPIIYIFIWGLLSLLLIIINVAVYNFPSRDLFVAFLYLIRFIYTVFIAYIAAKYIAKNDKKISTLKFINACYIIVCFIGFIQLLFFPIALEWYDVFKKIGVEWNGDPHINRLVSTDFDPNYLSCTLLIGLTVNLYLLIEENKGTDKYVSLRSLKRLIFFIIYIVTILLTKSRSGILGLLIIIFTYMLSYFNYKKINLKLLLVLIGMVFLFAFLLFFSNISVFERIRNIGNDPSAHARFSSWDKSFKIIQDTKFLGIGYNLYPAYNRELYGAMIENQSGAGMDSSLLFLVVTTGIGGLILYLIHFCSLFKNKPREVKVLLIAGIVVCAFNNLIFYSLWIFPLYLFVFMFEGNNKRISIQS